MRRILRWERVVAVISCYVLGCAIWIEILNFLAGSPLPQVVSGKWRIAAFRVRSQAAFEAAQRGDADAAVDAADSALDHRRRWNAILRGVLGTAGLLQYPLGVVLIGLGLWYLVIGDATTRAKLLVVSFAISAGLIAEFFATFRRYWGSLGW